MNRLVALWLALTLPIFAHASWPACFFEAANEYGIDSQLLMAIAEVESSMNACAVAVNSDGSEDLGLMQINSWWLPKLAELGVTRQMLFEPCLNTKIAAWILYDSFVRYGHTWKAVGAYNAGTGKQLKTENNRKVYAKKIADQLSITGSNNRLSSLRECE